MPKTSWYISPEVKEERPKVEIRPEILEMVKRMEPEDMEEMFTAMREVTGVMAPPKPTEQPTQDSPPPQSPTPARVGPPASRATEDGQFDTNVWNGIKEMLNREKIEFPSVTGVS